MMGLTPKAQFGAYFVISNVVLAMVFFPILLSCPTFFAAGVRMSDDFRIVVLCNWLVAMTVLLGKGLQQLLFGALRPIEIEHIYQNSGMSLMNSLLELVMFSGDFILLPVILTLYLQSVKVFHWILKDRFEHIFQHATRAGQVLRSRSLFALFLILFVDFKSAYSCAIYSFGNNPDVYFAFGFQFVVLFLDLILFACKIGFNTWELRYLERHPEEDSLEGKDIFMKVLELIQTSANLLIDLFVVFTFMPTRLPIYLCFNIVSKLARLGRQIVEFRAYLRASRELDSKLRDATEDDLTEDNSLCIICREDMTLEGVRKGDKLYPKKLDCGHIIHMGCLKSWFERSQVCPLCRAPVLSNDPGRQQRDQQQPQQPPVQPRQEQRPREEARPHIPEPTRTVPLPPFLNNHIPHDSGFFRAPENAQASTNGRRPAQGTSSSSAPYPSDNILRLRPNSLIPPDWTLLKLSNSRPRHDSYELRLSNRHTAQLRKVSQHPSVDINVDTTDGDAHGHGSSGAS